MMKVTPKNDLVLFNIHGHYNRSLFGWSVFNVWGYAARAWKDKPVSSRIIDIITWHLQPDWTAKLNKAQSLTSL